MRGITSFLHPLNPTIQIRNFTCISLLLVLFYFFFWMVLHSSHSIWQWIKIIKTCIVPFAARNVCGNCVHKTYGFSFISGGGYNIAMVALLLKFQPEPYRSDSWALGNNKAMVGRVLCLLRPKCVCVCVWQMMVKVSGREQEMVYFFAIVV